MAKKKVEAPVKKTRQKKVAPEPAKVEKPIEPFVINIPTVEQAIAKIEENNGGEQTENLKQVQKKELSPAAQKWKDYLKLQGITAEQFLSQPGYSQHRHRHLIEEILDFEKNNEDINI